MRILDLVDNLLLLPLNLASLAVCVALDVLTLFKFSLWKNPLSLFIFNFNFILGTVSGHSWLQFFMFDLGGECCGGECNSEEGYEFPRMD